MREPIAVPEYSRIVATSGGELVMSTPPWYGKHGEHATLLVDARAWPPRVVELPVRIGAAARLASGAWLVTACFDAGSWAMCWLAGIGARELERHEPVPFAYVPESGDDGPFAQLHTFGDAVIGVPTALGRPGQPPVHVWRGGTWRAEPRLPVDKHNLARAAWAPDGHELLEWNLHVYDAELARVDARGCTQHVRTPTGVFARHDRQLVEVTAAELVPRLAGHVTIDVAPGPAGTLLLTTARDVPDGETYDRWLYDPRAHAVAGLPPAVVGEFPKYAAFTADGDLVLHEDREHRLRCCGADQLASLARVPEAALPVPPELAIAPLDGVGASSRPRVAATGDHLVVALGHRLRFHAVDAALAVVELADEIVAVAAAGGRVAALDTRGVLHLHDRTGRFLASRPVTVRPRSLAATADGTWIVLGEQVVLVDERRTRPLDIAAPLAVAEDGGGGLVVACDDHRLVWWTGAELRDLPPTREQIVALAPLQPGKVACAGTRNLYLLDLADPELVPLDRRVRLPYLASSRGQLALCTDPAAVDVAPLDGHALGDSAGGVRYSAYTEPRDERVTVHGLGYLDDGRLIVALDGGRGNIVDVATGAALKLDPQPGDDRRRWIFFCNGKILIAD